MSGSRFGAAGNGALVGLGIIGVWGGAHVVATVLAPPGFEGEHLERSIAVTMTLAVVGSLIGGALLARRLRLEHPWPYAASGLVLTLAAALCGYGIARQAFGAAGVLFFVACVAGIYAALAAGVGPAPAED
ncbi:hypothetical protein GCM10010172_47330 [Paractinoplanes ferrugineus]|uniref:Uncharacterized protein n=1 Tax=Paractinoplanes ferrugineus TaxID=113564 RepID=A0A919IYM7_9ACTN|nr:hypothetical protein [Actinoplanes ferrugineus]GIE10317.1 hypothetical protein Afe05nite_21570 [Actinoplanes ferrugineus]